jgi:hypothetical protein
MADSIHENYFLLETTIPIRKPRIKPIPALNKICPQFKLALPIDTLPCIIPCPLSQATSKITIMIKKNAVVTVIAVTLFVFIIFAIYIMRFGA